MLSLPTPLVMIALAIVVTSALSIFFDLRMTERTDP